MDEATQVVNQQPRFTLRWEGDAKPGIPVALDVLLEANKDDPALCEWLKRAPIAGFRMTAGANVPVCHITRVE